MTGLVKTLWGHPLARRINVDSSDAIAVHRKIIETNPVLRANYLRWYGQCLPAYEETRGLGGEVVEIGSGAGFLKDLIPELVRTEVVPSPYADKVIDAMDMDFPDRSLRALFLIGTLHHFPQADRFFEEALRCLKPGGRLVMVEPNNSLLERALCRLLDHYEYFDDKIVEWANADSGRMNRANLAIPWVIFVRDRAIFEKKYPGLKIKAVRYHTLLAYIVSGGMSYRPFIPALALPLLNGFEALCQRLIPRLCTTMTIDIERR